MHCADTAQFMYIPRDITFSLPPYKKDRICSSINKSLASFQFWVVDQTARIGARLAAVTSEDDQLARAQREGCISQLIRSA